MNSVAATRRLVLDTAPTACLLAKRSSSHFSAATFPRKLPLGHNHQKFFFPKICLSKKTRCTSYLEVCSIQENTTNKKMVYFILAQCFHLCICLHFQILSQHTLFLLIVCKTPIAKHKQKKIKTSKLHTSGMSKTLDPVG